MSRENVESVERSIERFNGGDVDSALRDANPEIEWHDQRELPGATVHHGREAAAEHLRSVLRALPGYRVDAEEFVGLFARDDSCRWLRRNLDGFIEIIVGSAGMEAAPAAAEAAGLPFMQAPSPLD